MRTPLTVLAAVGVALSICVPAAARAQGAAQAVPVTHVASLAPGSILGMVHDERGAPVPGAIVSALGTTTVVAVTDRIGHFELRTLAPGPYLVRAHSSGYVASRGQVIEVRSSARTSSSIALRRTNSAAPGSVPTVAAGFGPGIETTPQPVADPDSGSTDSTDNHGEVAWRLRHARRSILKDSDIPEDIIRGDRPPDPRPFDAGSRVAETARMATNLFASTPFSGQVNLLTAGSFNTPQGLFTGDIAARSVAYLALGAPVGDQADWTVRAAMTQGDVTSWIVAGEYTTRVPERHRYDLGWSYAAQRYDTGTLSTIPDVSDGNRNAGSMYGYDTFSITPRVTLTYGARYAHYDYLLNRSLLSPRASLTVEPVDHFRISTLISRQEVAPGAEEFSPRVEGGVWLPPQRTFASLDPTQALRGERTEHIEVEVERDIAAATISVRAFHQRIANQQLTVFGIDGSPSQGGRYLIGSLGRMEALGVSTGIRAAIAGRVHGSIEYTTTEASALPSDETTYLWILAGAPLRPTLDRIHDVSTSIETEVPETSTRVLVLYRVSNAFAQSLVASPAGDRPGLASRFDVQVRQSLPFMDFSSARWEMLVDVRNFFRDASPDQSVYDELFVVRPPKRVVGGLTLRF